MTAETTPCLDVRAALPAAADDELEPQVRAHVDTCLRCQAEIAQYRRIRRLMRSHEPQLAMVPLGLHAAVMRTLAEAHDRTSFLRKGALIGAGGLIVAAAGTTAGILLARHRHRLAA